MIDRLIDCHIAATALPEQFPPSKSFIFPKRKFRARGEEQSFRAERCQENSWLHYNVGKDAAFCIKCEHEKKFLSSKKREPALFLKGIHIGRKLSHPSKSIRPVIAIVKLWKCYLCFHSTPKILLSYKVQNMQLMIVLNNLRFLVHQGLAFRGDGDEFNSNLHNYYVFMD